MVPEIGFTLPILKQIPFRIDSPQCAARITFQILHIGAPMNTSGMQEGYIYLTYQLRQPINILYKGSTQFRYSR
ncbi:hypothetical protein C450_12695 [Halococcus salifodinae DSM 8989]|uniref:Uncharacterized protein n=1 Tax=Halococcus salifodinae DSM 8989 TaxID=1227456 RepID=M0N1N0_9EURY|nr:hypothetical protein C450_12695 [Halococcus salifodinae DSM 8989]